MTAPMVIAHVLSSFGQGGQERVAVDLARLQRLSGHQVLAFSIAPGPAGPVSSAFRAAGVFAETVAKRPRVDLSLPVRLAAHLRSHRVNVVHTHNPHALIYGAPAARLAGAVVVHSKHGMNPDTRRRLWLRRLAAKLADAYVTVTPRLAKAAIEQGDCDPSRLHVVPNGIDVVRFAPNDGQRRKIREELAIPDDAWVVGTVGRLAPEKDQALLVDAMGSLLCATRHLVIVGDGAERGALRARVDANPGRDYVHMLGDREDVESLLAAFDAFALTSRTEGLPLVLLEAMATGLPVVSTAVGGIPDLVKDGVTGFLVPAGDRGSLADRLGLLSMDKALSRNVGDAGRREVLQRHGVDRMAREYVALYESILQGHRGARGTCLAPPHVSVPAPRA
jgi:glycosyltransferase involved in cell wall biosynthesis